MITSDLHLTDSLFDGCKWEFLEWLRGRPWDAMLILGDLTDGRKSNSSILVNRIVDELSAIADMGREVHLLMGENDYSDPDHPFFGFLHNLPRITFHSTPGIIEIGNARWAFYPHSKHLDAYQDDICRGKAAGVDFTVCHQVFDGAVSGGGKRLSGWSPRIKGAGKIFAGGVHRPQVVGDVEYVGAPYPVRFGDDYKPHVVVVDGTSRRWSYSTPPHQRKVLLEVDDPEQIEYDDRWRYGDQVKIVLSLSPSSFWKKDQYREQIANICDRNDLILSELSVRMSQR
jgi:hypothetical protein